MRTLTAAIFLVVFLSNACSTAISPVATAPRHSSTIVAPNNEISDIAQREILRRQDQILRADEAAIQSHQRQSQGDLEGAVNGYRSAVSELENS